MADGLSASLRKLVFLFGALLLAACGGGPMTPDRKDPVSVTRAFVEAFNARDLQRMLPLHDQVNIDAIAAALAGGVGSEAYEAIFAPGMVELLAKEAGKVEGPRYDRRDAVVKVGTDETGDVYTVILSKDDKEEWSIVAHSRMGKQQYEALPAEPKK